MRQYIVVHTVETAESEKEKTRLAAARAIYAELLKYYSAKTEAERSA